FSVGYILAVVGPNGAGKTTLGFVIMGIEGYRDFEGDVVYKGQSIKNLSITERAKKGITLAWQEPARFEGLSVEKFIQSSAKNKNPAVVRDVLKKVGMDPDEYVSRKVDTTLSGGERKKIELASILAMEPELVILDEPDSGIDVSSLENIFEAIKFLKSNGSTIILITHSLAVLKQAEYACLMCNGSIIRQGSVSEIGKYFGKKCVPCVHKNKPEELDLSSV
ncbi:MAG: ATP-binding cassette domain-containing protein, partial [Actinobacteria bacterium]|nr:ATP-binding cassette domain-containing protein [Actinomycetota bacterium]